MCGQVKDHTESEDEKDEEEEQTAVKSFSRPHSTEKTDKQVCDIFTVTLEYQLSSLWTLKHKMCEIY